MVSCTADQLNEPLVAGVNVNAACTELVSIGLLNWSTMRAIVATLFVAWAGVWLRTTGSSGCSSDWAMNILALVLGTEITGVVLVVALTTMVSLVLSRLTRTVPGAYNVVRLVSVWIDVAVFKTTKT